MNKTIILMAIFSVVAVIVCAVSTTNNQILIDRGLYIVNRASLCTDCHNERDSSGRINEKRVLSGAQITFRPITPMPDWATYAPNLTPGGILRNWTDQQLVRFLMTGVAPEGGYADHPMPPYRFNEADAKAVTAYLRSLPAVRTQEEPSDHQHQH